MTEYDLRKLPLHRLMEAREKARIILYQRAYDRGIKITPELITKVKNQLDTKVFECWEKKDPEYWMDFGEKFIEEVLNGN